MTRPTLLLLRGGYHKEFAFKTLFRKGCRVAMIDRASSSELTWADYPYVIADLGNPESMAELAKRVHCRVPFGGIVTFYDSAVIALAMLSEHFHLDYLDVSAARVLTDKHQTRRYLAERGWSSVRHRLVRSREEARACAGELGYPMVLKPVDRTAGIGVNIVRHSSQVEALYEQAMAGSFRKALLAEEYIQGREYAVEVLLVDSEAHVLAISEKQVAHDVSCVETIDLTPARLQGGQAEKIERFVTGVLKEFAVYNHLVHVELRMNEKEDCQIIEINPRPAGGNLLESVCRLKGINVYDALYDLALKHPPDRRMLCELRDRPFQGYTLFYSFTHPIEGGVVRRLEGVEQAAGMIDPAQERFSLAFDEGSRLTEIRSNDDVRGYIYLQGEDPEALLSRAKRIEATIRVEYA